MEYGFIPFPCGHTNSRLQTEIEWQISDRLNPWAFQQMIIIHDGL